ncbi:V8-like Glu-specific endopeptidase [Limihaloglobus sulfuriphilus]|uniref:Serine protease n=1 Tax=Limihaloglobus sulfuriphilus TaxID=1851148 RepID=A0A1Q2MAD6_9BACT|nr:trypsin-like peptidase domain-containing protein [Limihaloglobus sulfuriphilus]AQQ69685.1 V8-like Glu-specific endopeptidase [Limihaloglobus sulfuriphilus]
MNSGFILSPRALLPAVLICGVLCSAGSALPAKSRDVNITHNPDQMYVLVSGGEKSAASVQGQNGTDVDIPEGAWATSEILINSAPSDAVVSGVDVHYEIVHSYVLDLTVDLSDGDLNVEYNLWDGNFGSGGISETETGIAAFNGRPVNQYWFLWAIDNYAGDYGYIDSWWIKIYYSGSGAAPEHDDCAGAIAVTESAAYSGSTAGATGTQTSSCGDNDTNDVWHVFTPAAAGLYSLSLCGSSFDTTLAVYDECGGAELACNDDSCEYQSMLTLQLNAGEDYYIRIAGYGGETGSYTLVVEPVSAVLNDDCANAAVIAEDSPTAGSTIGATGSFESSCASHDFYDVWYSYTPSQSGTAAIEIQSGSFDTTLSVWDGCGGAELACNDDHGEGGLSAVELFVQGGTEYLIRVAGYGYAVGDFTLLVSRQVCEPPAPAQQPGPADGQTAAAAETELSWSAPQSAAAQGSEEPIKGVIYGSDDRLDYYQISDPDIIPLADSTAVIVSPGNLADNGDGTFTLPATTLGQWYEALDPLGSGNPLCPDEPYINQPAPGKCSAFLVEPDIVVTAGHCAAGGSCSALAFVFGFVMLDADAARITVDMDDVYYCSEIIETVETYNDDWAIVRLDRPVSGREPLTLSRSGIIPDAQPVFAIGSPYGLPLKLSSSANVMENSMPEYFQANLDVLAGNSGSPVFNAVTLEVEGILVRGNEDFSASSSCDSSYVCPDSGCPEWEEVTRTSRFLDTLYPVLYDVYFDSVSPPEQLICENTNETSCDPTPDGSILELCQTYYWQVVTKTKCGETAGDIWSFRVESVPGDFDDDCSVDSTDFSLMADSWLSAAGVYDIAPLPDGDGVVDLLDLALFARDWLAELAGI